MPIDLTNPAAAQNRGRTLLALLGSFWTSMYNDNGLTSEYARARNQSELQTFRDVLEFAACACRFDVPVFHKSNWSVLRLRKSDRTEGALLTFGTAGSLFGNNSTLNGAIYQYGISPNKVSAYPSPDKLSDVTVIVNRMSEPSVVLTKNIDFIINGEADTVEFKEDPFNDPLNLTYPIYDEVGNVVDTELELWLFMADYDWQLVYEQFGYALDLYLESSENYKSLVNLVWDSLVQGSTFEHVERLFALLSDNPLVIENLETVEAVSTESNRKLVITDKHVYVLSATAAITVSVGQTLKAGDRLTDAFTVYRPYRDTLPTSTVPAISVGAGVLVGPFQGELVFNNASVPLTVTKDPNGRTRVEWQLGGEPGDVKLFWDTVHANGTKPGAISLAQLMDNRYPPAQTPDPLAVNLPVTVNPLDFLAKNVLRNNASIVTFNTASFGSNALGTSNSRVFRQVIPAHNMVFVLVRVSITDNITMNGAGTSTAAGYTETLTGGTFFAPDPLSESSPHGVIGSEGFTFSSIPE